MERELTRSAMDALGKRLRSGRLRDGDEELFQAILDQHYEALQSAVPLLGRLTRTDDSPVDVSSRVKTRGTLVEKLVREGLNLSGVQDIAGARFVVGDTLAEQDSMAERIRGLFDDVVRTIDRRVDPRSGYRALHVVVRHERCLIEVQVRTRLQHLWAEAFERLADVAGRQLRYGGRPDAGRQQQLHVTYAQLMANASVAIEAVENTERVWSTAPGAADDNVVWRQMIEDAAGIDPGYRDLMSVHRTGREYLDHTKEVVTGILVQMKAELA